jgi:hypothetical protein
MPFRPSASRTLTEVQYTDCMDKQFLVRYDASVR